MLHSIVVHIQLHMSTLYTIYSSYFFAIYILYLLHLYCSAFIQIYCGLLWLNSVFMLPDSHRIQYVVMFVANKNLNLKLELLKI